MALSYNWIDLSVFFVYIVVVFCFGIYMSRKEDTAEDFFLAGRRLPWFAVALSLFATNISSGSLIGLAGDAFRDGLAVGILEWGAILGLFILAYIFLPYYQRRRIYTLPEFLEQRYNLAARSIFAIAMLLYEIVVFLPFVLYGGGVVVEEMFGVPFLWGLIGIATFVGIYTIVGGLGAVVWTDVIQGILMIVSGVVVTVLGLVELGGIDAFREKAADKLHVCLAADHERFPFWGTMFGGPFLITVFYWCLNQTIVQRTLGARSEWDARMGTMCACLIKLILPFVIVLPGIIMFALEPGFEPADKALPELIQRVVPTGLSGLLIAAILAALMSSADSSLNSWATIFTHDIYHRLIDPEASPRRLISVGRIAIACLLVVVVVRTTFLSGIQSILQFLLTGAAYMSGPVVVVFLLGVLWSRATSVAAVVTMLLSPVICYACQNMKDICELFGFVGYGFSQSSTVYWLPLAVCFISLLMIVVSLLTEPKSPQALKGLIWSWRDTLTFDSQLFNRRDIETTGEFEKRVIYLWKDYRLVGAVAMVLMIVTIWWLR